MYLVVTTTDADARLNDIPVGIIKSDIPQLNKAKCFWPYGLNRGMLSPCYCFFQLIR